MRKISISMLAFAAVIGFAGAANADPAATNVTSKGYVDARDKAISDLTGTSLDASKSNYYKTATTIVEAIAGVDEQVGLNATAISELEGNVKIDKSGTHINAGSNVGAELLKLDSVVADIEAANTLDSDGIYAKKENSVAANLTALDTQVNTNTGSISAINSSLSNYELTTNKEAKSAISTSIGDGAKGLDITGIYDNDKNFPTVAATTEMIWANQRMLDATVNLSGDITGTLTEVDGKVTELTTDIAAKAVGTSEIDDSAVTGAKLKTSSCAAGQVMLYDGTTLTCEDVVYWNGTAATNTKPSK